MTRNQRGATLVVMALMTAALMSVVGLVAQVGMLYHERTRMQVAADAAALAGAKRIPEGRQVAINEAVAYASRNGFIIPPAAVSIDNNEYCTVAWQQPADKVMDGLLKLGLAQVGVRSRGDLHCINRIAGTRPFGLPEQAFAPGAEYVLKQTAQGSLRGNFQALALDGNGAQIYEASIVNGAQRAVNVGDVVPTEPGNIVGPTVAAVNRLIGYDQVSFADAVAHPDQTNRIIVVPLLTRASWDAATGRSPVVVAGFARFYLTYTTSLGEVHGRFVDRIPGATVQGTYNQYVVKLVG